MNVAQPQVRWAGVVAMACSLLLAPVTRADVHELRVPLRDGKLSLPELSAALSSELGLPAIEYGTASIDVQGLGSSITVAAMNKALGQGCQMSVDHNAVVIRVDPDKLPHSINAAKHATRDFVAHVAPDATARQQAKFGLLLPAKVHPDEPIVILIHGLDCSRDRLEPLAKLMRDEGYQVGTFGYPDDQPLIDSSKLFAEHLTAFHETFPTVPIDIVTMSMGGLVARSVIEGPSYPGGVQRLIQLAPPNHGSQWARLRFGLEMHEQWCLWRHDKDWSPTWAITDGLGEAGGDLLPNSKFIESLNERPRRDGVKYTVINGNVHPVWKFAGEAATKTASLVGSKVAKWTHTDQLAAALRDHRSDSDGAVSLKSTSLDGVADVVTVPADHNNIYQSENGAPPVAWAVIRERLKQ